VADRRPRETPNERRERRSEIDDPEVVLAAALRFLEARSRSVAEVRKRLGGAGYRSELVDGAIARLTDLGMLDDAAFATQWVESRDRAHPRGEHALIIELRQKGIDAPTITAVLKARREVAVRWEDGSDATAGAADARHPLEAAPADPDATAARKLLARNARALERVADPRVRRQKAYALLARNGFAPDVCSEASAQLIAAMSAPDDEPTD
jgi:hypothetical protein